MSDKPTDVFISYSREDQARVFELASQLRSAGVGLWIDQGSLDAAAQWGEQIVEALDAAKVMLLMISPSAVRSDNVAKEVTLISERRGHILPLHLEQTIIPPALKYPLAGIQHIELYNGDPEEKLQTVLRSLTRLGVSLAPPARRPVTGGSDRTAPESQAAAVASAESRNNALAILPFENLSADPDADYFSDGLTDELFSRLSAISEIELISRWSSMQFKGQKLDPRTIGAQLGARHLVGGSVRKHQDSVRISVQLVDVGTNRQLWGSTFKGELANIFEIQEQVAQQIVEALKLKLSFSEKVSLTKRSTVNAQAFDLYLRGQELLYQMTRKSIEHSIQLFEKAIELDPRYAAAYASAASAYGVRYQWFDRDTRHREKAQELSFKALMYDPNLAEAYSAMGLSYFMWGKFEESSAACRKAMELNPEDLVVYWTLGRIHFSKGELALAAEFFRTLTRLKPDFYAGFGDLAQTCDALGLVEEADKVHAQLLEMMPMHLLRSPDDARGRLYFAKSLVRAGKREQAMVELQKTLEASVGDCLILYNLACVFAELGDKQKALETLRAAVQSGYGEFGWMQNDPDLASLRDEPAFQELKNFVRSDGAG